MPGFRLSIIVLAAAAAAANYVLSLLSKTDDKHDCGPDCGHDQKLPSQSGGRTSTQPPRQPPPSSYIPSQIQVASRTSATSGNDFESYHIWSHAEEHRQDPLTSARTQASHQFLNYGRATQSTVKTASTENDRLRALRRAALAQTISKIPATTDYNGSCDCCSFDPLSAVGSSQTATSTFARGQASYQRSSSPEPARIAPSYQTFQTHSRSRSSSSNELQTPTVVRRKGRSSVVPRSPNPASLPSFESDERVNVKPEGIEVAKELRERARRYHREMYDARALAKSANKRRDYQAKRIHTEHAGTYENAMERLNAKAADIIFRENNKVCMQ
jgi:hypothetical protein